MAVRNEQRRRDDDDDADEDVDDDDDEDDTEYLVKTLLTSSFCIVQGISVPSL